MRTKMRNVKTCASGWLCELVVHAPFVGDSSFFQEIGARFSLVHQAAWP
jgi:hypothetical protein